MKYLLVVATLALLYSCKGKDKPQTLNEKQKELETGSLDSANRYMAEEIGWTAIVPEGWEIETKEQLSRTQEKGKQIMEETNNVSIDASGLKQLLNLRKDKFNSFLSTMEPYSISEMGSYDENNSKLYLMMKEAYSQKGIHATYSEDTTNIDGLQFYVFRTTMYDKDKKTVILNQAMYSRLINGYDVGMTINYSDEKSKKELEQMLFSSTFSKRDKSVITE